MKPTRTAPSAKALARAIAARQAAQQAHEARVTNGENPGQFQLRKPFRAARVVRRSGCCR